MPSSTPSKPHVLIVGAGLGGLSLAQCLRARSIPFKIFERDPSANFRDQGWAIALHTILPLLLSSIPSDMPSIDVVDHLLPLKKTAQLCFYDIRIPELKGKRFEVEAKNTPEKTPTQDKLIRANRVKLREWLMTGIDVQWGKKFKGFKQDETSVTVEFEDGTTATGDYLVGADGARSIVRSALAMPNAKLENVPECFITGTLTVNKEQYERQMKLAHSSYVVHGDGFHIFVGLTKVADDEKSADYSWDYIWRDEARTGEYYWTEDASKEELYRFAVERTKDVDPIFTELIRLSGPANIGTPPLILRDMILESMPVSRVTLLGDAAHPMTPFRGEGGCHAIEDSVKLAKTIGEGRSLGEYQEEMLKRGSYAVKMSRGAGNQDDAPKTEERTVWGRVVEMKPFNGSEDG